MVLFRIVLIALCVFRCSGTFNNQCITNVDTIDCKNTAISKPFGSDRTREVHTINIDSCYIENNSIDDNDLDSFSNLNMLIISNSSLSAVSQSVFSKLKKLNEVVIENTEWILVHPGQFKNNTLLRKLHLSHNKITSIPEDTFPSSLTVLDLSHNRIVNISRFAFGNLLYLQELKLSGNLLTNLHSDIGFPSSLKLLYLDSNNILNVEPFTFSNCTSLEELSLSFNQLHSTSGDIFQGLHNLATLRLDNNLISQISFKLFSQLNSLMFLYLHRNDLQHADLNELQIDSIMQLHIDSYLLKDNLKRLSYFPKFDGIIYAHITVSKYQDIILSFKSECTSENCGDVIKNSMNHEVLHCPHEETCLLMIPNVFGRTNFDYNNYLCKDHCSCIVNESNYFGLIIWNNIVVLIALCLYLLFQNKDKILSWISKNESDHTHSSNSFIRRNDLNEDNEKVDEDSVRIPLWENQESSELPRNIHTPSRPTSFVCCDVLSDVSKNEESGDTQSSNTQRSRTALRAHRAQRHVSTRRQEVLSQANFHYEPASETSSMIPVNPVTHKTISNAFPQGNFSTFPTVSSPRSVKGTYYVPGAVLQDGTEYVSVPPKVLLTYDKNTPQAGNLEHYEEHVENSSVLGTKLFKSTGTKSLPQVSENNYAIVAELPLQPAEAQDYTESLKGKMGTTRINITTTKQNTSEPPPYYLTRAVSQDGTGYVSVPPKELFTYVKNTPQAGKLEDYEDHVENSSVLATKLLKSTGTTSLPQASENNYVIVAELPLQPVEAQDYTESSKGKMGTTRTNTTTTKQKTSEPPRRRTISDFRNEEGELFKVLRRVRSDLERKLGEEVPSPVNPNPLQPPLPASTSHALDQSQPSQPPSAPSRGKRQPNGKAPLSVRNVPGSVRPAGQASGTSPLLIVPRNESSVGSGLRGAATPPTASQSTLTKTHALPGPSRNGAFAASSQRVGPMLDHGWTSSKTNLKIGNLIEAFETIGRQ